MVGLDQHWIAPPGGATAYLVPWPGPRQTQVGEEGDEDGIASRVQAQVRCPLPPEGKGCG